MKPVPPEGSPASDYWIVGRARRSNTTGQFLPGIKPENPIMTPCWLWHWTVNGAGYGKTRKHEMAHRVTFSAFVGEIPRGKELHHLCHTKLCTNPAHVELVSRSDHNRRHGTHPPERRRIAGVCLRGHKAEYKKKCNECNRLWMRDHYHAKKRSS